MIRIPIRNMGTIFCSSWNAGMMLAGNEELDGWASSFFRQVPMKKVKDLVPVSELNGILKSETPIILQKSLEAVAHYMAV